jgi:hypothetical protein
MSEQIHPMLNYPTEKCRVCGQNTWWYSAIEPKYKGDPSWICGVCSPPASEIAKLKMRIIKGNVLLTNARIEIYKMPREQEMPAKLKWIEAINKLQQIGRQVENLSTDCIYIIGNKKIKKCLTGFGELECFTCPNSYWWVQELFDKEELKEAGK